MPLQNVQVHRNCYCYDSKDTVAKLSRFEQGDSGFVDLHTQEVFFLLEGAVHISTSSHYTLTMVGGEFIYLPAGTTVHYQVREKSVALSMRIQGEVPECHIFQVGKIAERIENKYEGIYAMKVNERMQGFLSNILETFGDGLKCRHYLQMEVSRMLYLIHAYYPQEECLKFFAQILSPDVRFSEFVRTNWKKYSTVKEFAAGICMTPQQFSNRFRKIFGETPYEWMTQQKAQLIYNDICRSDLPLKEIALKYEFNTQANFFHFCKHAFGITPGQIRKSLKYDCGAA